MIRGRLQCVNPAEQPMQDIRQDTATDLLRVFRQAVALHGQGRLGEAETLYAEVLRRDDRHFDSIYRLGILRLQQNRFAEAEVLFRRAVKADKRSADAQHHLAIALTGLGRLDDSIAHYRKALALKPRDAGGP